MAAPRHRHFVVQGESLKRPVGLTILQHHVEVALPMLRLGVRQRQLGHFLVLLLVLHLHFTVETLWSCVIAKMNAVVVHAGHDEVPLHLLVVWEIAGIVGCDEICVGHASRQVDFQYGYSWRDTRGSKHTKESHL